VNIVRLVVETVLPRVSPAPFTFPYAIDLNQQSPSQVSNMFSVRHVIVQLPIGHWLLGDRRRCAPSSRRRLIKSTAEQTIHTVSFAQCVTSFAICSNRPACVFACHDTADDGIRSISEELTHSR
jgi:hypothetical protein